jgi:hypothetical protein
MTLLIGFGIYVGLMAAALVFFRFVRSCDEDMRLMTMEPAQPAIATPVHQLTRDTRAA